MTLHSLRGGYPQQLQPACNRIPQHSREQQARRTQVAVLYIDYTVCRLVVVAMEIAGQRWYKVEVGPYATAEEASNAEAELRQKYDSTYGAAARGNSAALPSVNDNTDE